MSIPIAFSVYVGKRAVAVVVEEAVGAEIAGDVEIVVAVVIGVAVAHVERPAAQLQAGLFGDIGERAVVVVVEDRDAAAVVGGLKALGEKARAGRYEDIDRLEIGADKKIDLPVAIVIERDGFDGVPVL